MTKESKITFDDELLVRDKKKLEISFFGFW